MVLGHTGYNLETRYPGDDADQVWFILVKWFLRRRFLKYFKITPPFLSIFSNGGHFGSPIKAPDTILKGDHLRTIPPKFGPNRPIGFRGED